MSRLTKPGYKFNLLNVMQGLNTHAEVDEVLNRLAAYKDIGLEPEEIKDHEEMFAAYRHVCGGKSPEEIVHALELMEAERNGRLVRVPCKIGDTVWAIRSYHGILRPQQGVVSEMYFRLDMTLQIVVKYVARGEPGRTIFLTRAEAEAALERSRA